MNPLIQSRSDFMDTGPAVAKPPPQFGGCDCAQGRYPCTCVVQGEPRKDALQRRYEEPLEEFPPWNDWRVWIVAGIVAASTFGASFLIDTLKAAAP